MDIIVSLNGADNVGKTTQIRYLEQDEGKKDGHTAIHHYDNMLSELVTNNKLRDWWWNCSDEEHVQVIIRALNSRASSLKCNGVVLFLDRGATMFKAVCIATIAAKNKCSLQYARNSFDSIVLENKLQIPTEESVKFLLKHSDNVGESVAKTLRLEGTNDDTYKQYQHLLQEQLEFQEQNHEFTDIIYVGSKSKIEVQNEIRQAINKYLTAMKKPCLPLVLTSLKVVVMFGGMSECGKSTLASKTSEALNSRGLPCHRLKIGYLLKNASYSSSAEVLAAHLVNELDIYVKWHHYLTAITLESLHRVELADELKRFLGDKIQVVYLDASLQTRTKRALCSLEELRNNDEIKEKRGAPQVKTMADLIVDTERNDIDKSTNVILNHLEGFMKTKQIAGEKLCMFSDEFVLSAGTVLVKVSTGEVCLIHLKKRNEWTLPKGRKNEGETLEEAAIRETFEETGYKCALLPVDMETRAPPCIETGHTPDEIRYASGATEPLCITSRMNPAAGSRKIIVWFVAKVLEEVEQYCTEQEKFDVDFKSFEEAVNLLPFEDDKNIVKRVEKMVNSGANKC